MSACLPVFLIFAAYLFGGVSPGYWLVRWVTGDDVRGLGGGGTGATNVGRILGRRGFVLVLVLDAAKGVLTVVAAGEAGLSPSWTGVAAFAVLVGNVWPLQLRFHGGKGIAVLLGTWLVLAPWALAPCALLVMLAYVRLRRFTPAGLCGLCLLPASVWWAGAGDTGLVVLAGAMLGVVLFAHRDHFRTGSSPESA